MKEEQLATEMSLSRTGIQTALERLWKQRLENDGPLTILAIHEEDERVVEKLWKAMQPSDWFWKIDPTLPRDAWYIENGPYHVWGCRGEL